MGLGMLMADTGRTKEGFPLMEQAVQVSPENANNLNNMATYLLRLGKGNSVYVHACVCVCANF